MNVVTHEDEGSRVVLEGLNDGVDARHVEVGRGLVEKEEVGRREQKLDEGEAAFFSPAQDLYLLEDVVPLEEKGPQQSADFLLVNGVFNTLHGFVENASFEVEYVHPLLGEIAHLDVVSEFTLAVFDRHEIRQDLEQGRLAGPIRPDQYDPFLLFHLQVEGPIDQVVSVGLPYLGQSGYALPAARGLGKTEGDGSLVALGSLDTLHLIEKLYPRLGLGCLGCLGPEPPDEVLVVGDLSLLVAVGGLVLSLALGFLHEVLVEVSLVAENLAVTNLEDPVADRIEKLAVVGNRQQGSREFPDAVLKPAQGLQVEVVGRLVEHE